MPSAKASVDERSDAYCPHCGLLVKRSAPVPWPDEPARCPHCRLLIGAGRCRSTPATKRGTKGAAAGVLRRQARQDDDPTGTSRDEVVAAIREAARTLGIRPDRLLMIDYTEIADRDPAIPPLKDVFAHFTNWKAARRAAGS